MEIALRVAGIGPGHEVITTSLSWVATSNVTLEVGARLSSSISIRSRATSTSTASRPRSRRRRVRSSRSISPGCPSIATALRHREETQFARGGGRRAGLREQLERQRIGAAGDFVSFSFHPNKNVTTIEGGALVLNDEREAKLAEQYRLQGVVRSASTAWKSSSSAENSISPMSRRGWGSASSRTSTSSPQSAASWRAFISSCWNSAVRALGLGLPPADFTQSNWHMFQVYCRESRLTIKRADVMAQLHAAGIGTGVHYPAIHLFALYRKLGWKDGDFPHAEKPVGIFLTLPLFPTMTRADAVRVVEALAAILKANQKSMSVEVLFCHSERGACYRRALLIAEEESACRRLFCCGWVPSPRGKVEAGEGTPPTF